MKSAFVPASMEYWDEVASFLDGILLSAGCPEDDWRLIATSAEELFTNIASYAYGSQDGMVQIECSMKEVTCPEDDGGQSGRKEICIRFMDQGTPYDPFSRKDPDLNLPIEERPIGGLGIYMVKQFMDKVGYVRQDGYNITVIKKKFLAE